MVPGFVPVVNVRQLPADALVHHGELAVLTWSSLPHVHVVHVHGPHESRL